MPRYDYQCPSCGNAFEAVRSVSEPDPSCPACSSERVLRRFSVFATSSSSAAAVPASSPGACACGGACACR